MIVHELASQWLLVKDQKMRILHVVPSYRQLIFSGRIFAVHYIFPFRVFSSSAFGRRARARSLDADLAGSYENLSVEVVG